MSKTKPKENEVSSNNILETLLNEHKQDHYNEIVPLNKVISSGSLLLDQYVKARSGGVIRLVAKTPESGKTSQAFVYASNFMQTMPNAKTLYIKAEGRLSQELKMRTGLEFVESAKDWKPGTVFVLSSNIFETIADIILKLSKSMFETQEKLCIIIDSLDGLILKSDKETKGISSDGKIAGVPKLTKLLFRHLALPINHYDILLLITGQYSADIKIDQYSPTIPRMGDSAGGNSVPHQCDYVLQYLPRYKGDWILENPDANPDPVKNKIVGVWATVEIKKSATDNTGTKVKIPIKRGRSKCAIWIEKEVVDLLLIFELLKRSGPWFSFDTNFLKEAEKDGIQLKEKLQGLNAVYEYVENNGAAFQWLYQKMKTLLQ